MSDFQEQYSVWDEFLKVWPLSRLATMTLDEYAQSGSKETFTYWLEFRLVALGMGSIGGGSAFKVGVFSRRDTEEKTCDAKHSYTETHAWYSSLGNTAEIAFKQVHDQVLQIATLASNGDVNAIEALPYLGSATKWKIAFHYQNRHMPILVGVLTKSPLEVFLSGCGVPLSANASMSSLQMATLAQRPSDLGILEFGSQIWESWSLKNLRIWKLSHGDQPFTNEERQQLIDDHQVAVHGDTGKEQGKRFAERPVGTLFFLCHGNSPQLIGQFTSDALPCKKGEGWLQRSYRVLKPALRTDRYTVNSKYWSPQGNSTFSLVGEHDLPEFESTLLKPYFGTDLAELAGLAGDQLEAVSPKISTLPNPSISMPITATKPVSSALNRIYYGPPGTGKTYTLTRLLKRDYEQTVQSVSSEEWRKQVIAEKFAVLKWWEGAVAALYDLGGKAKVSEIAGHPFIQAIFLAKGRSQGLKQTLWGTLQHHTLESSKTVNTQLRMSPSVFDKTSDSYWQLAGDWKEACADIIELVQLLNTKEQNAGAVQRYSFVTFHQSYGYEEFVEGLRPVLNDDAEVTGIHYEIRSGVFKELCLRARLAPDQRFAMVIDEINRGNISKILGELITLIESDKRDPLDGSPPPAEVTLAYSGEKFSVPANVDIIGTMNTADRSLALLDTALRRRFDFVALMPDTRLEKDPANPASAPLAGLVVTLESGLIDVRKMLHCVNQRIEALYDRDHCIGHAYFTALAQVPDGEQRFAELEKIFRNRIIPLLEEYFFEDWQKIRLVLGDNQKKNEKAHFISESKDHDQDLNSLFGSDHGLDTYGTKRRYAMQESTFSNPDAYIGIY
jgi:5-methylcytosine-specific restriction enzyme B